jgi:hypothetical protein
VQSIETAGRQVWFFRNILAPIEGTLVTYLIYEILIKLNFGVATIHQVLRQRARLSAIGIQVRFYWGRVI